MLTFFALASISFNIFVMQYLELPYQGATSHCYLMLLYICIFHSPTLFLIPTNISVRKQLMNYPELLASNLLLVFIFCVTS